ncbi:MAG: hypothetical protein ACMUEL_06480 [Flavobacteriales bacterium Tduv]
MLRSTEQIIFSELNIERSIRKIDFFKKLKYLNPLGRNEEKKIRKIYQKGQRIKGKPAYSEISLFNDDAFESLV